MGQPWRRPTGPTSSYSAARCTFRSASCDAGPGSTAIAVVGVGAIGGVVAASLAALERDFLLCVRQPFDELVVQTPRGILKARPQVATSVEGLRPVPWVLLDARRDLRSGLQD